MPGRGGLCRFSNKYLIHSLWKNIDEMMLISSTYEHYVGIIEEQSLLCVGSYVTLHSGANITNITIGNNIIFVLEDVPSMSRVLDIPLYISC